MASLDLFWHVGSSGGGGECVDIEMANVPFGMLRLIIGGGVQLLNPVGSAITRFRSLTLTHSEIIWPSIPNGLTMAYRAS